MSRRAPTTLRRGARAEGVRVATIDVGSNSIHMLVAQVDADGRLQVLDRAKEQVGLGHQTLATGRLSRRAMDAGIRTLSAFRTLAARRGADRIKCVATSAVREAVNGGDFIERIQKEVGLRTKVIPGREEARLTFLGVSQALDLRGGASLILDVGGGSVELILVEEEKPVALHSVKIGVARLADAYLESDPPSGREAKRLAKHLSRSLEPILEPMKQHGVTRVIGTSGTMLALVNVAAGALGLAPGPNLNNVHVPSSEIARLRDVLLKADRAQRLAMKGIDEKRERFLLAGALLADHVLATLEAPQLVACTWALREGVLVDYVRRHQPGIKEEGRVTDVRRRSILRFLRHLRQENRHSQHVGRLALTIFGQLRERLRLDEEHGELLEFAALLHDVGRLIDHRNHHLHAYYLITRGELLGLSREEVEIVALVARYHRKGMPKASDHPYGSLPRRTRRVVRSLAAILRVADALDRSHYAVVKDVQVRFRGERAFFELVTDGEDAALEIWESGNRANLMEKVLGRPVSIRVAS